MRMCTSTQPRSGSSAEQRPATRQRAADKPLVEAPELGERIKDTDREPHWVPGAYPTIFQNETGDPFNHVIKEVDLKLWGPHVLRSRGWYAQAHITFMYWWTNMIQRAQALSAKKWYVRDNPSSQGLTVEDLAQMNVKHLAKQMVGYTTGIPGSKASKNKLRRLILAMVRQIEIETRRPGVSPLGDIPCLFGTLTSQRYHWDGIMRIIAAVEGIADYSTLTSSQRRSLVNKYPLFVAWYCSLRLELVLKTVVVPTFGAHSYIAVYEWSPTGGMVHVHYVLWKSGAPRFDLRAQGLESLAASLRRAGWHAGPQVGHDACKVDDVVEFFARYITEWNVNKTADGNDLQCHVAERVNQALPHTASYSEQSMLELLKDENRAAREEYYARTVRTEHLHDFHYPDPLGPPNPSQPCAQLLKGTCNMWYCKNGYPKEPVCEICQQSVQQDALRPELWRVHLMRNCPVMNAHMPLATMACQSNTDAAGVLTRNQCDMYLCKYCAKHTKRLGQRSILYEVLDDMERKDEYGKEAYGDEYEPSKLGAKLHRAFMAEVGEEMCQAEVAHHANKAPEYLCSRPAKFVYLYKKALGLSIPRKKKKPKKADDHTLCASAPPQEELDPEEQRVAVQPSDLDLYEGRADLWFPNGTPISEDLPAAKTPEDQVLAASLFDFFRLVRYRGGRGKNPHLEWHEKETKPIVIMSPVLKFTLGADFAFAARWALMQYHPWTDRREFLDLSASDVEQAFHTWMKGATCPWYIVDEFLAANGLHNRAGAGPSRARPSSAGPNAATPANEATQEEPIAPCTDHEVPSTGGETEDGFQTEASSAADDDNANRDTHVLKMLYKGNLTEVERKEQCTKRARVFNAKHSYYKNTRCTTLAQEESSALPAGVFNVNEDSDDDEAYSGEQKEIAKEMDELRAAKHWINQPGWNMASEGRAYSQAASSELDLRLNWTEVKQTLAQGSEPAEPAHGGATVDRESVLRDYPLDALDPTQRAFADRVLVWVKELAAVYEKVLLGRHEPPPELRTWLGGSAGAGKSSTLRTVLQHARLHFHEQGVSATIELTAYTGVAAFNIGFGAKTACSSFKIFPNTSWKAELQGDEFRKLEQQWGHVALLIIDEISFIGRAFFARIHFRLQQAKRRFFTEAGLDPHHFLES